MYGLERELLRSDYEFPRKLMRSFLLLFVVAFGVAGCDSTCADACAHVVECDGLPTQRMSTDECEEACRSEQDLYDGWADLQKVDAFQAELDCLNASTCEDIGAGVCYDDSIWSF